MPDLAAAAALALMAGLNLPLGAFLLSVAIRLDIAGFGTAFPALAPLGNIYFLAAAAAFSVVEFIVDRIPRLDSLWDIPNTLIRPGGSALFAYLLFSPSIPAAVTAAVLCAAATFSVHLTKAKFRNRLNRARALSKNVVASTAEDAVVVGVAAFLVYRTTYSLILTLPLIAIAVYLVPFHLRTFRPSSGPPSEVESGTPKVER